MNHSSFTYKNVFKDHDVMVFIPHEDDEINVAGATIYGLRQEGFHVICVFATNGDRSYLAETRIREAAAALKMLGVPYEDIIILGYPDGGLDASRSPYAQGVGHTITVDGHDSTYGIADKDDFPMAEYGKHTPYTRTGFLEDVENLIRTYHPANIIAVDFDSHPDHRACSIALETAIGHILNEKGNTYFPIVLKAYAYNTGFESVADFNSLHLYSTKFNRGRLADPSFETDNPVYHWEERIRLPVTGPCRNQSLSRNLIYQALRCHVSQRAFLKANQIINSDQVYWLRRTDNLAFCGSTTASSGNADAVHDFKMIDVKNIADKKLEFDTCLWEPASSDREKSITIHFYKPQNISAIKLYGNVNRESRILEGQLLFSNGYSVKIGPLERNGQATDIPIEPQSDTEWVTFQVLQAEGPHPGLTEWEIFDHPCPDMHICKILVNGEFAYHWDMYPEEMAKVGVYAYPEDMPVVWKLNDVEMTIDELNEKILTGSGAFKIQVLAVQTGVILDEISIKEVSWYKQKRMSIQNIFNRIHVWKEKQLIKRKHHRLRVMKRNSLQKL
ncbi:PIG-L family deacetylase [Dialister succinatiphilus]|uniref:PIG-L family deacetylase n=1 Tax=Dialister succinatiphilus TaxID=487173 RepID=UPI0040276687